jgi:hypothetical protein
VPDTALRTRYGAALLTLAGVLACADVRAPADSAQAAKPASPAPPESSSTRVTAVDSILRIDSTVPADPGLVASLTSALEKCAAPQDIAARWTGKVAVFPRYTIFVPDSAPIAERRRPTGNLTLEWPRCGENCLFAVAIHADSGVDADARIARMLAEQRRVDSVNKDPKTEVMEFDVFDTPPQPITTPAGRGYVIDYSCGDCASTTLMLGRAGLIATVSASADAAPGAGTRMCEMMAVARTFRWRP